MLRRINFYSVCFAFGVSALLILAGSRYTDNTYFQAPHERRRNSRNFLRIEDGDETYIQPIPTNPYDGSPDINKLLENERSKIKQELLNLNFSYLGPRKLENFLLESGGQPRQSLIVSTWRSGTTFLGDILNAVPGNFYHYEPLLNYGIVQVRGLPDSTRALDTLKKMFKCQFDNMNDYFEFGRENLHQFSHNTRLWDHCKYKRDLCFDASFTEKFCKLFPFQSMKVVRIRLHLAEDLIKDQELSVKVVLLIRDPRAVLQSRQHRDFCLPSPDCGNPELLCADMVNDYVAAAKILKKYPQRLMLLRYEELALNPYETAQKVLNFLGLTMMPSIDEFLHTHTNKEAGSVSSTYRISRKVPFRWKKLMSFDLVGNIQIVCKAAMDLWGYEMANNASHMKSEEFNPLKEYYVVDI